MLSVRTHRFVLCLLFSTPCFGGPDKIAPDLTGLNPSSFVERKLFHSLARPTTLRAQFRPPVARQGHLDIINAGVYTLPAKAIEALSNSPNVVTSRPTGRSRDVSDYANVTAGAQLARQYGWDGTKSALRSSTAASFRNTIFWIGAPISTSPVLYISQSFVPKVTSTADQYGHGTHVAGIVAGNGTASTGTGYVQDLPRDGAECQVHQPAGARLPTAPAPTAT